MRPGKIEGRRRRGHRGWDGWMASPMQLTRTWANSGRWCGTARPGTLQSMGSQGVRHDWATEQKEVRKTIHRLHWAESCLGLLLLLLFSHQVTSNSLTPHGCRPPGSSVHGIPQGKNTGVGCHFLSRDLPDPGIKSESPTLQADSSPLSHLGSLWL